MMHPIQRYCARHNINQREFASVVGVAPSTITDAIKGRNLGMQLALAIQEKTGGEITVQELSDWHARAA